MRWVDVREDFFQKKLASPADKFKLLFPIKPETTFVTEDLRHIAELNISK